MSTSNCEHYEEIEEIEEYAYSGPRGEAIELIVYRPVSPEGRRTGAGGKRTASHTRRQLVVIVADSSRSMKGSKALAATEAAREVIYQGKMRSNGDSLFDVSIAWFGEEVYSDPRFLLTPVQEINEDEIVFRGDSGRTNFIPAIQHMMNLVYTYDRENLAFNEEKERVPPPLMLFLSDGRNTFEDPLPLAKQLTSTPLSIGVPPMLVTVGIEFDGGEPDVELLTEMASATSDGHKLYFDISSADQLVACLATAGSSAASTTDELHRLVVRTQESLKRLPSPKE